MLQHIALTINDSAEIKNFYEKVLLFNRKYKFSITREITRKLFTIDEATDVYMMSCQDIHFEIFISLQKEKKVFSHVCLAYRKSEKIYNKAIELGYKAVVKQNPESNTYFIWDKSGNMFEIKEVQKI